MEHFYIFYITVEGHNVYERTCGTKQAAEKRVEELKKYHSDTFYLNDIPKDFKYFY